MQRTLQQNKLYHELCGQLHKTKELIVWDGRFINNPARWKPMAFSYDTFRTQLGQVNLEYPKDEKGISISSAKLSIDEMNNHISFIEVLCAELEG